MKAFIGSVGGPHLYWDPTVFECKHQSAYGELDFSAWHHYWCVWVHPRPIFGSFVEPEALGGCWEEPTTYLHQTGHCIMPVP